MNLNLVVLMLIVGAVLLGLIAVIVDRINFPQKPFTPKEIPMGGDAPSRDRTGAHITDVYVDPTADDPFGEDAIDGQ